MCGTGLRVSGWAAGGRGQAATQAHAPGGATRASAQVQAGDGVELLLPGLGLGFGGAAQRRGFPWLGPGLRRLPLAAMCETGGVVQFPFRRVQ